MTDPGKKHPIGNQPVRVLEANVLEWFEGKYPEFRQELEAVGVRWGLSRKLRYFCDKIAILADNPEDHMIPYIEDGVIGLHETFMSYLWTVCYSFMVIFDERMHGPHINQIPGHGYPLGHFAGRGYSVLTYGLKLIKEFQPWPDALPSPERCSEEDQYYVTRANGIYVSAADFILCHEIAHSVCGHLHKQAETVARGGFLPSYEIRTMEREADQWALACVIKGIRQKRTRTTIGMGVVAGLGALLLLGSQISSTNHPDMDDRMLAALNELCSDPKDNLWGVADAFLIAWNETFKKGIKLPSECDTYQDLFQAVLSEVSNLKKEEDRRRFGLD